MNFIFNNIRTKVYESVAKIQSLLSQGSAAFDTQRLASSCLAAERLVAWSRSRPCAVSFVLMLMAVS
jgi:hypothetical protein